MHDEVPFIHEIRVLGENNSQKNSQENYHIFARGSRDKQRKICVPSRTFRIISKRFAFIRESYALIIKRHENELSGLSYAYI